MTELPRLNRMLLASSALATRPEARLLDLPERVIQFGTGAFLRGFIEPLIDSANRSGRLGGRVLAISSTGSAREQILEEQDGLYTLAVRGIEHGEQQNRFELLTSLSRVLPVAEQWNEILRVATSPDIALIVSNTTEVGITFDAADSIAASPPRTFPARLAQLLYVRARAFDFAGGALAVLPCELIENNGDRLHECVLAHTRAANVDARFESWLERNVSFCNTLVDRIVPGVLPPEERTALSGELGYRDELITVAEPYRLFAIQADGAARGRLQFLQSEPGVMLCDDITPYRLRKVRLLNGAHTMIAPLGLLCGLSTVGEAVQDKQVGRFLRALLFHELVPATDAPGATDFAHDVLERFGNPFIRHALRDITLQQTAKLRARVVPSLLAHHERTGSAPYMMALGFAAFLLYVRERPQADAPADDHAEQIRALWTKHRTPAELAVRVCAESELWGVDLNEIAGFASQVGMQLQHMMNDGTRAALASQLDDLTKGGSRGLVAR